MTRGVAHLATIRAHPCERRWPSGRRLFEFPAVHDADEVLCAFGQCSEDLGTYLQAWTIAEGEPPVRHLAAFLGENGQSLIEGRGLCNPFWSGDKHKQQVQVREWLRDPSLVRHGRCSSRRRRRIE
jgi:hypothetical protein